MRLAPDGWQTLKLFSEIPAELEQAGLVDGYRVGE
jgi:ABC-type glycerol-3-phosphate transport system permease component